MRLQPRMMFLRIGHPHKKQTVVCHAKQDSFMSQNKEAPSKFVLMEVYKNAEAPAKHKETTHYALWRDTVADMMAEPR